MNQEEFCNKANGKPWENRADNLDEAMDCWGLVIASFKHIENIDLPVFNGYINKECTTEDAASEALCTGNFKPAQARDGAIMTVMNNKGRITHVGRCLAGRILHSTQSLGVRWDTYSSINNQFKNIRYFRYAAN